MDDPELPSGIVPVYVDKAIWTRAASKNPRVRYCHMMSTDLDALHAMAEQIGVKRHWFDGSDTPHYDLNSDQREKAIEAGAAEASRHEIVGIIRFWRAKSGRRKRSHRKGTGVRPS